MIIFITRRGIVQFFDINHDIEVDFIFDRTVSLRALIVSKSFDLGIWFLHQLCQIWTNSQKIYLVKNFNSMTEKPDL